ncbi:E3 ubiquitin-protein ligase TRIM35-like [Rhinichthys klamathensis goyatoka]|uniref:E3 ubiquitin-protein ligase TRIM35-like n=1 Tax=Rhinichthys klamathensis goyatoka TaxID=3034132 RepID=UPI0024B4B4CD|nr:E3 ubiquitin-protein ligase TRIM35-like [Rhinichthys klamathensis goyatoka]
MASRSFAEEDLSCPVCCCIFINPVLLSCSHSFCSSCIQRVWENNTLKECPVCRRTSSNDRPPVNLALKNLCESFQQERREKSGSGVCRDHNEKLKLFCLDDQQPVCVVCRDSRKHTNHRFCPVDEAVADKKEKLRRSLELLQDKLRIFDNFKQSLDQTAQQIKIQTQDAETQMNEEFKEIQEILHNEKTARITALREEEEKRSQRMKEKIEETNKQISSLTITIRDIEEQMKAEDASFLQNFKSTLQRAKITLPDPQKITEKISVPKHNLKFTVLQKMQDNMKTSQDNVDLGFGAMGHLRTYVCAYCRKKYSECQPV